MNDINLTIVPIAIFDNREQIKTQSFHLTHLDLPKVNQDFIHTKQFLISYSNNQDTYNAYRRECERFLQWIWLIKKISLQDMRRQTFEDYLTFTQKPPKHWLGYHHVPRFMDTQGQRLPNPDWRPYILAKGKNKYVVSQAAWKSLFTILSSFYQFLIDEEYTEINPVTHIRQKSQYIRKQQTKQPVRRLTELQWEYVIRTAELMAEEQIHHERTLFIMSCLYGMYLRISELTASERWSPQMNHFYQDRDGNWWFKTVGKGNKERDISVSNAMLDALKRYRQFRHLTPLPSPRESIALITKKHSENPIESTRHIRRIVQTCFNRAIERMNDDDFKEEAEQLKAATVHWLRHTGISDDVKIRPREHVRDDAGHSSSAITDRYIDIELRQRHESAKRKVIKHD